MRCWAASANGWRWAEQVLEQLTLPSQKNFSRRRSHVKTLLPTGESHFIISFLRQKWPNAGKSDHFGFDGPVRCFMRFVVRCLLSLCPCPR